MKYIFILIIFIQFIAYHRASIDNGELDLSNRSLLNLPDTVLNNNYSSIDISFNQLNYISANWLRKQTGLINFNADFNNLNQWPFEGTNSTTVRDISMQANQLNKLSSTVHLLTDLEQLNLKENNITYIPKQVWQLANLETLKLSFNEIGEVAPDTISPIINLDLQSNRINKLSRKLFEFPNLKVLHLADNNITSLPIDTLPKMDLLVLTGNPIPLKEKKRIMRHNPNANFIMW